MELTFSRLLPLPLPEERKVWDDGGFYLAPSNQRGEVAAVGEHVETNELREQNDQLKEWITTPQWQREIIWKLTKKEDNIILWSIPPKSRLDIYTWKRSSFVQKLDESGLEWEREVENGTGDLELLLLPAVVEGIFINLLPPIISLERDI